MTVHQGGISVQELVERAQIREAKTYLGDAIANYSGRSTTPWVSRATLEDQLRSARVPAILPEEPLTAFLVNEPEEAEPELPDWFMTALNQLGQAEADPQGQATMVN